MAHLLEAHAEGFEHAGGDSTLFAHEAEEEVFGADVVVAQASRLINGELDDLLGPWGEADFANDRALAPTDDELNRLANLGQLNVEVLEDLRRNAFTLADKAEQQVLCADVVVVEALRLVLGERQHLAGAIREAIEAVSRGHALLRSPLPGERRQALVRRGSLPLRLGASRGGSTPPRD